MKRVRLAVVGCCGRMGRAVVRAASTDATCEIVAGVTMPNDPYLGRDLGSMAGIDACGVTVRDKCDVECDVAIEFTLREGTKAWAQWCAEHGAALVSGTTGLGDVEQAALRSAAQRVPIVRSSNMSIGVNLMLRVVRELAAALDDRWDVEIVETHHRDKIDAPSGTARSLLAAIKDGRGGAECDVDLGRSGACGPRGAGRIGVHAVRMGSIAGEHEVHFAVSGEVLSIKHRALSRDIFAAGALRAALWVADREPGLYGMRDVLG